MSLLSIASSLSCSESIFASRARNLSSVDEDEDEDEDEEEAGAAAEDVPGVSHFLLGVAAAEGVLPPAAALAFASAASLFFLMISANPPPFVLPPPPPRPMGKAPIGDCMPPPPPPPPPRGAPPPPSSPTTAPAPGTPLLSLICDLSTFFSVAPAVMPPRKAGRAAGASLSLLRAAAAGAGVGAGAGLGTDFGRAGSGFSHVVSPDAVL